METQMLLLDKAQLIFILVEMGILVWAMITTMKPTKENRPQQFLSMRLLVGSCGLLSLLYLADFLLYSPTFMTAFLGLLWIGCTWMWGRSLKRLPEIHKTQDELEVLQAQINEQFRNMFK